MSVRLITQEGTMVSHDRGCDTRNLRLLTGRKNGWSRRSKTRSSPLPVELYAPVVDKETFAAHSQTA